MFTEQGEASSGLAHLVSQLHTSPSILSQVAKLLDLIPAKSCLLESFKIFVLTQLLLLSLTLKQILTCRLEQKAI